ncbi:MAG TPA: sulfurtransferase complex subunit TusB [Paracoccaceae bacterium]|nr:sulfurtransferase complex subunit TusB [Paracoccaceae bacterium]
MSTLHTVNKSPFSTQTLLSCLNHCKDGDAVLMIEDGVYGGLSGTGLSDLIQGKAGAVKIYYLSGDAAARGLGEGKMLPDVEGVDYDGFVDLVAEHNRTQSWL